MWIDKTFQKRPCKQPIIWRTNWQNIFSDKKTTSGHVSIFIDIFAETHALQ